MSRNSRVIWGSLLGGIGGALLWIGLGEPLQNAMGEGPYNTVFQFWVLIVLGGAISFAHQTFMRTREEKERQEARRRAKDEEEKAIFLGIGNDLLAAYNRAKRVRRLLRAKVLRTTGDDLPPGAHTITAADYDERMGDLIDAHLEFEASERRVRSYWFLMEGRYPELRGALDSIRTYLQNAIEEYEDRRSEFTGDPPEARLSDLPALREFLGGRGIGPEYWAEFKQPFRTALRCLRMEVLERSPIEPAEGEPPPVTSDDVDDRALGRPEGEILVVSYRREWSDLFEEEAGQLREAFGEAFTTVEHIGSTAVPELEAEPVLDLLAEVESLGAAQPLIPDLAKLGYEPDPDRSSQERMLFRKVRGNRCTHHLWLVECDSDFRSVAVRLRDHLRADGEARRRFEEGKRERRREHERNPEGYVGAVWELAAEILARSGATRTPDARSGEVGADS